MCGIFGYVGSRDPLEVCLSGLELLEYRGYDSTGISGIYQGQIATSKKAGKLSMLRNAISLPKMDLAIAHTRWATHGKVSDENAHPHLDATQSIAIIHNGIIENYKELKDALLGENIPFSSETDSEVVANLIAKHYRGNLVEAMHKTLPLLRGIFAFLVIHKNHPEEIIAAAKDCPLSIGYADDRAESIISSDPNAFRKSGYNILFLKEGEIARVKKGMIEVYNRHLDLTLKKTERLEIEDTSPSKGAFPHFMLKEIFEQPDTIRRALLGRFDEQIVLDECKISPLLLQKMRNIWILGCGTSAHAGQIGALLLEEIAQFPASLEIASEARYRNLLLSPETLVVAMSQSGETADTLAALRETMKYGCTTLGICNVKNSTLAREASGLLSLKAGPEVSVCSTKAFTAQLTILTLLTLYLAGIHKKQSKEQIARLYQEMQKIPAHIEQVLQNKEKIEAIAKKYAKFDHFFFLGRRYMLPTCMEAALKLKELSYVNANGYPAGELKHGPIALLNSEFPVVAFCANEQTKEKILSNLAEVKARGAPVLAISPVNFPEVEAIADDVFYVPSTIDILAPFASSVAGQLLAYYIAKERGCDIDQPRNLAKSVTVE